MLSAMICVNEMPGTNPDLKWLPVGTYPTIDTCFSGGSSGTSGRKQKKTSSDKKTDIDKSAIDKMNARRGPGDSTKADSGGGDADKRVVSRDVDNGPINNDRGA